MDNSTSSFPQLNPQEHAELERIMRRQLSNDEAQQLIHDATVHAAFEFWLQNDGAVPTRKPVS